MIKTLSAAETDAGPGATQVSAYPAYSPPCPGGTPQNSAAPAGGGGRPSDTALKPQVLPATSTTMHEGVEGQAVASSSTSVGASMPKAPSAHPKPVTVTGSAQGAASASTAGVGWEGAVAPFWVSQVLERLALAEVLADERLQMMEGMLAQANQAAADARAAGGGGTTHPGDPNHFGGGGERRRIPESSSLVSISVPFVASNELLSMASQNANLALGSASKALGQANQALSEAKRASEEVNSISGQIGTSVNTVKILETKFQALKLEFDGVRNQALQAKIAAAAANQLGVYQAQASDLALLNVQYSSLSAQVKMVISDVAQLKAQQEEERASSRGTRMIERTQSKMEGAANAGNAGAIAALNVPPRQIAERIAAAEQEIHKLKVSQTKTSSSLAEVGADREALTALLTESNHVASTARGSASKALVEAARASDEAEQAQSKVRMISSDVEALERTVATLQAELAGSQRETKELNDRITQAKAATVEGSNQVASSQASIDSIRQLATTLSAKQEILTRDLDGLETDFKKRVAEDKEREKRASGERGAGQAFGDGLHPAGMEGRLNQMGLALGEVADRSLLLEKDFADALTSYARNVDLRETENALMERNQTIRTQIEEIWTAIRDVPRETAELAAIKAVEILHNTAGAGASPLPPGGGLAPVVAMASLDGSGRTSFAVDALQLSAPTSFRTSATGAVYHPLEPHAAGAVGGRPALGPQASLASQMQGNPRFLRQVVSMTKWSDSGGVLVGGSGGGGGKGTPSGGAMYMTTSTAEQPQPQHSAMVLPRRPPNLSHINRGPSETGGGTTSPDGVHSPAVAAAGTGGAGWVSERLRPSPPTDTAVGQHRALEQVSSFPKYFSPGGSGRGGVPGEGSQRNLSGPSSSLGPMRSLSQATPLHQPVPSPSQTSPVGAFHPTTSPANSGGEPSTMQNSRLALLTTRKAQLQLQRAASQEGNGGLA